MSGTKNFDPNAEVTINLKISTYLGPQWSSDSEEKYDEELAARVGEAAVAAARRFYPHASVQIKYTRDYTSDLVSGTPPEMIGQLATLLSSVDFAADPFDAEKAVSALLGPA